MAGIKIHGSTLSTAAQRVFTCLYEKDIDFELVPVDMRAGEHKSEAFLSKNPFGQVPAFEQGDLYLFESRAITQYIAEQYADKGTALTCPSKTEPMLLVWKEVEAHQFDPVASKLNWEIVIKPIFGMTTDPGAVEELETKLVKVLDVYEARLSKSKFLACDCFTLADMHHLPNINLLMGTQLKKHIDSRPHVSAWVANITARPAWVKVLALQNKQ
ncbi:hypothetical protein Ddye_027328 [Dipteronia dyeriana]|uniref:glutathione transferase n=1 Tax=Dipteronia dyeriana TaxID=168575 RepID=A0AAD9TPP8_9ROSI|nr:hypothetical protein Ddye_027328 [Dipteronia dyeriana]